jgi:molybdopterin-guanine dinucleotide biosynthesis protein
MTLERISQEHVFDDVTTDEDRARVYVTSGEIGLEKRPEISLMNALAGSGPPQHLLVVGPSGAGKTSLILKVAGDLERRALEPHREVLVLKVGDRPASLDSGDAAMKLVLDTVAVERGRFSNVDPAVLRAAAADERTATGPQVEHRGSLIRRMERRGIHAELESVIEPEAVADLQLLYHERDRDLRSVLQVAQRAAEHAVARGSDCLEPRDVRAVVAGSSAG